MTLGWWMPIIFPFLVPTSASIHSWRSTSNRFIPCAAAAHRLLRCLRCPSDRNTNHTSVDPASMAHPLNRKAFLFLPRWHLLQLRHPAGFNTSKTGPDPAHNRCLYNSKVTQAAGMLANFDWVVLYGFNSGHFLILMCELGHPFHIILATGPFANGHTLFGEMIACHLILNSATSLLYHVRSCGTTSKLTGYLIYSHQYYSSEPSHHFWELQLQIVKQLWIIRHTIDMQFWRHLSKWFIPNHFRTMAIWFPDHCGLSSPSIQVKKCLPHLPTKASPASAAAPHWAVCTVIF